MVEIPRQHPYDGRDLAIGPWSYGDRRPSDPAARRKRGQAATAPTPQTKDRRKLPRALMKLSNSRVNIIVEE
jgi:hypothetical protein